MHPVRYHIYYDPHRNPRVWEMSGDGSDGPLLPNPVLIVNEDGRVHRFHNWAIELEDSDVPRYCSAEDVLRAWLNEYDPGVPLSILQERPLTAPRSEFQDLVDALQDEFTEAQTRDEKRAVKARIRKAKRDLAADKEILDTTALIEAKQRVLDLFKRHYIPLVMTGDSRNIFLIRTPLSFIAKENELASRFFESRGNLPCRTRLMFRGRNLWEQVLQDFANRDHINAKVFKIDEPNPMLVPRSTYLNMNPGTVLDRPGYRRRAYEAYLRGDHYFHMAHQFQHLCKRDISTFPFLVDWEARALIDVNEFILLMVGPKGSGKSLAAVMFSKAFNPDQVFRDSGLEHILGDFSIDAAYLRLVDADDVAMGTDLSKLKAVATSFERIQNRKHKEATKEGKRFSIRICADAIDEEMIATDTQSRRFLVVAGSRSDDPAFFGNWMERYLPDPRSAEPTDGALAYYFALSLFPSLPRANLETSSRQNVEFEIETLKKRKQWGRLALVQAVKNYDWDLLLRRDHRVENWDIPREFLMSKLQERVLTLLGDLHELWIDARRHDLEDLVDELGDLWAPLSACYEAWKAYNPYEKETPPHEFPAPGANPFGVKALLDTIFDRYFRELRAPQRLNPSAFDGYSMLKLRAVLFDLGLDQFSPVHFVFPTEAVKADSGNWIQMTGSPANVIRNVSDIRMAKPGHRDIQGFSAPKRKNIVVLPTIGAAACSFMRWHSSVFLPGLVGTEFKWSEETYDMEGIFPHLLHFMYNEPRGSVPDITQAALHSWLTSPDDYDWSAKSILDGSTDVSELPLMNPFRGTSYDLLQPL